MSSFPCFPSSSIAALSVNHLLSVIHWLFTTQSLETKVNLCSCVQAIVRIHLSGIQWRKHSCSCLNMQNGVPCACLVFLFVFCFVFRVVYANGSYIFLRFHKSGDYMVDAQYIGKQWSCLLFVSHWEKTRLISQRKSHSFEECWALLSSSNTYRWCGIQRQNKQGPCYQCANNLVRERKYGNIAIIKEKIWVW